MDLHWRNMSMLRKSVLLMLLFTVLAPILLYTDRLRPLTTTSSARNELTADVSAFQTLGGESRQLNLLPQERLNIFKEPARVVYADDSLTTSDEVTHSVQGSVLPKTVEHKSRALYATNNKEGSERDNTIRQVTHNLLRDDQSDNLQNPHSADEIGMEEQRKGSNERAHQKQILDDAGAMGDQQSAQTSGKVDTRATIKLRTEEKTEQAAVPEARVRHMKDQLIRARVYLSLAATRNNPHFIRELRVRMKDIQKALGDASKDSELQRNASEKIKAMEQTLAKGKQIQDDCAVVVKKLRAILHSTEEQLRVHKKQTMFLTQLTAKTLPKGLHCLPLRLSTDYYGLGSPERILPNQDKLEDPRLYHYALFSDNVLAAAVVVNSTVFHAKEPKKHVFHIVTDRLNYAAMRMWFLANPPGSATIQVQNVEEFTWLNSSYSPVLKQLGSQSMIDYYFKAHHANSDSNLKFRNPKYLSILNHLRFYLPEIFPKLDKVLFLDDDIVVQKDLSALWSLDLKGNVNGAVETCGELFHRFDRYLNFSHPLISKNFDPHACGWAYGMNVFDLKEWKKQNITQVYHNWQKLNHNRQLWKLGTLPPGLITFWKRTYPLNRSWHVLGLGYNPNVSQKEIDRAAVVHYNGNMKPWLEISIPKYRSYWSKYIDYDHVYLRECNINP